jgi:hypothetical protein
MRCFDDEVCELGTLRVMSQGGNESIHGGGM